MALSNSYDFTLTSAQLIASAYRKIGIRDITPLRATEALEALELIIKSLSSKGFNLVFPWAQQWITQTVTTSIFAYTLNAKIFNVDQVFLRRASNDTIVSLMSKEEYSAIANKTTQGSPNRLWQDKQLSGITIYLNPVPENSTDVLHLLVVNKLQNIDSTDNNIDIEATWFNALIYALAADLAQENAKEFNEINNLRNYSLLLMEEAKQTRVDLTSTFISFK